MRWGAGEGGFAPKFTSEIRVDFASKSIGDKYPKFYPLNFKSDPKICVVNLCEFLWAVCYVSDI